MKLRIKELLDSSAEFSEFKSFGTFLYSLFTIKEEDYIIVFHEDTPSETSGILQLNNVDYSLPKSKLPYTVYSLFFGLITPEMRGKPIQYIFTPEGILDTTSNTGNAVLVFSTVANITKLFIEKRHPKVIYYAAKETNRYGLYNILGKKLISFFPRYTMTENNHFYFFKKET